MFMEPFPYESTCREVVFLDVFKPKKEVGIAVKADFTKLL